MIPPTSKRVDNRSAFLSDNFLPPIARERERERGRMFGKDTRSFTYEYFQHSMATKTRKYMQLILRRRGQKQTPIHPNEKDKSELVRTHVKRLEIYALTVSLIYKLTTVTYVEELTGIMIAPTNPMAPSSLLPVIILIGLVV